MAERRKLFDKPMAELREAFVRNRFGQEDVFGNPDIEAWLAGQRKAERPIERMWRRFIDAERVRRPFHIRELLDLAVSQELPRGFSIAQMADVGDPLVAMLCESVDRRRVDVLPADERLTLFLLKGEDGAPAHAFALTPQTKKIRPGDPLAYTLSVPSDKDLLQVVLSRGWSVGPKKIVAAARRLLCDGLEACIREERGSAEADFDSAVAVSADGTKIVHADWVVVLSPNYPHPNRFGFVDGRIPASAFRDHKILLTGPCSRCRADGYRAGGDGMKLYPRPSGENLTVELFFQNAHQYPKGAADGHEYSYHALTTHTRASPPEQQLLCFTDGRVLLTHREQCPFPLPTLDSA